MSTRIFVSGYGIISALGFNADENLNTLKMQKSGIEKSMHLQTSKSVVVGEVKASNDQLKSFANISAKKTLSRTALLGLIASREAIASAKLEAAEIGQAGIINGTSVGGMDISEIAYSKILVGKAVNINDSFSGHDCGHSTHVIAEQLKIKGYNSTISTACSSSANSIMHGAMLIKSGQLNCAVVGGTDALSLFTLNGFDSLKILDSEWCRPFDKNRKGLNLGEGAAYLVLESEEHIKARNGKGIAELVGYGNANDAYHQTASSPEGNGAYFAIKKALDIANLSAHKISYINAHGTGTNNNDQSESWALQNIFSHDLPPYSSTKAFTGHTLGAAGGIEAVFSVMALQEQSLLPNINLNQPMGIIDAPNTIYQSKQISNVLSNSFGFGGNCSSLIFSKA